jgi:hypothetical protein
VDSKKSAVYAVLSIGGRVTRFDNNGDLPAYCKVENLDAGNGVAVKYQDSDNGSDWSDITGTNANVSPRASNGQSVVSVKRFIALFASGNASVKFSVERQVNGAPDNLGSA